MRRDARPQLDTTDPAFHAEAPTPEQMADAGERQRLVRAAVDQLPDDQATVIRAAYFEEKTHSEIADALDIPLGTVKSRLRLAVGRIRDALEPLP